MQSIYIIVIQYMRAISLVGESIPLITERPQVRVLHGPLFHRTRWSNLLESLVKKLSSGRLGECGEEQQSAYLNSSRKKMQYNNAIVQVVLQENRCISSLQSVKHILLMRDEKQVQFLSYTFELFHSSIHNLKNVTKLVTCVSSRRW